MNDNMPPLPPCAPEFKPRWPNDPGGYTAEQMQAYARAAIEKDRERQSVPALPVAEITGIGDRGGFVERLVHNGDPLKTGDKLFAAAPQPQPVVQSVQASQCHNVMCQPYCDATGELVLPLCKCKPANQQKD